MTDEEQVLMHAHVHYTRQHFDAGIVVIYGPVMAASGAFGIAIVEAEDEAEVHRFFANDPTIRAGLHTYDISPMRVGAARAIA